MMEADDVEARASLLPRRDDARRTLSWRRAVLGVIALIGALAFVLTTSRPVSSEAMGAWAPRQAR